MKTHRIPVAAEVTRLKRPGFPSRQEGDVRASLRRLLHFKRNSTVRGGFSLVDLLLVVAAGLGIAFVILPALTRPRVSNCRIYCSNNLKQVGLAFRIWAGDNNDKMPMQVSVTNGGAMELTENGLAYAAFVVMSNELNTPRVLFCPEESNRKRVAAQVFAVSAPAGTIPFTPTNSLSYFVGLDATDLQPSTILTGDDHFLVAGAKPKPGLFLLQTNAPFEWRNERHPKQGNICLTDGSVQKLRLASLSQSFDSNRHRHLPLRDAVTKQVYETKPEDEGIHAD